ncbi:uncharacterized protein BO95DRAFT_213684 [Aspergillus brunneoviolaceus CBS 621.78]|uniref:Uncharacterized protein n=1 Tax=Aspergillus brunneoviolaceus CBS 621.78 TaxID=1450534 RepID=A0ACD1G297_9EURO|nr:hypothetical protein BO95DRAFT_213684 [Aspergillus brunneoviolaceus CBS 621.78]RAH43312.1 hypothetical protein BO95DRAFT_213684 [Aspergillus brunneoviolaceus CBS 621.78]
MRDIDETYISEFNLTKFTQSTDNLSTDFIGNVKLGQAHVRRPEEGVPWSHGDGGSCLQQYLSTARAKCAVALLSENV